MIIMKMQHDTVIVTIQYVKQVFSNECHYFFSYNAYHPIPIDNIYQMIIIYIVLFFGIYVTKIERR